MITDESLARRKPLQAGSTPYSRAQTLLSLLETHEAHHEAHSGPAR
jgi:hypothetical protein